jgi:hypothetical protein
MFDPTTKPQQMTNKSPRGRTLRTNGWRVYSSECVTMICKNKQDENINKVDPKMVRWNNITYRLGATEAF